MGLSPEKEFKFFWENIIPLAWCFKCMKKTEKFFIPDGDNKNIYHEAKFNKKGQIVLTGKRVTIKK